MTREEFTRIYRSIVPAHMYREFKDTQTFMKELQRLLDEK